MLDPTLEHLIGMTEAGRLMGRNRETVRRWIKRGVIEGVELDGKVYTTAEAIRRAVQPVTDGPQPRTPAQAGREDKRAVAKLKKLGVIR